MIRNGWTLYAHPLFDEQYNRLLEKAEAAKKADPAHFQSQPAFKLLATIRKHIEETIPADPSAPRFRQGNTLGKDNRHWFRAKFHERYRLFFRFSAKDKIIVYVWVNDEATLRKAHSKTDPYAVFESMLKSGNPPSGIAELLSQARKLS